MATSTIGPAIAAASPSATPMTNETHITERPMNSDTRAPKMRRDSMSWPSPSVPSAKRHEPPASQTGGARTASRNCSIGEWGATKFAVSARRTMTRKHGEAEHRAAVFPERGPERRERRGLREDGRRLVANRTCQRGDVSGHGGSWDR